QLARDLAAVHPQDRPVQGHVLPAGELRVEARADLEDAADASADLGAAARRRSDPAEDLQQGGLARAVPADEADDLSLVHLERDVVQRSDLLVGLPVL